MSKLLNLLIIALMFIAGLLLFPQLPEMLPMHWNIRGQVDSFWPKQQAIWFLPLLTLGMFILFNFLPQIDPKKEMYKKFEPEWKIIQTAIIGFMAYLQGVTFFIALHPQASILPLMFIGLGTLFIILGNYMSKIRQNYFIGIRLPWTLASEENWNKTHRFASWSIVIAGIITLAESYFLWFAPVIIFGSIIVGFSLPVLYSFLLYKKMAGTMKYIFIVLALMLSGLISIKAFAGEDDWICKNGQWVKHGNPIASMPVQECR